MNYSYVPAVTMRVANVARVNCSFFVFHFSFSNLVRTDEQYKNWKTSQLAGQVDLKF